MENEDWYQMWEEGLQRSLKRKNSSLRNVAPGLLEALHNDLATIANCPRRPPGEESVQGRRRKSQTRLTRFDRKFARDVGIKLDSVKTK